MTDEDWKVTFLISRQKAQGARFRQSFTINVDPDEYVLDGIERIWAFHDRSICFRHACHHSTCGACGMLVNGVEKLTCITSIRSVTHNGGLLKIEPLRNFPVVADLVVDMRNLYLHMEDAAAPQVVSVSKSHLFFEKDTYPLDNSYHERLVDCIECGMCVSACPSALTNPNYFGPATLAGVHQSILQEKNDSLLDWIDCADGLWRCHNGFECTAVCPSNVDPAWRIMDLRKKVIRRRISNLFSK